jgi:hypothetical protein
MRIRRIRRISIILWYVLEEELALIHLSQTLRDGEMKL